MKKLPLPEHSAHRALHLLGASLALLLVLTACAGRKTIQKHGLHAIKLGDQLPEPGVDKLKGVALRDTFFEEEEFSWRGMLMEYKQGLVYLEEDFFYPDRLNRIRVETPELKLKNGLRVGKTVADLGELNVDWFIAPIPGYDLFDFYSRLFPRTHFLVRDPQRTADDPEWENYKLGDFSTDAPIVAIVLY